MVDDVSTAREHHANAAPGPLTTTAMHRIPSHRGGTRRNGSRERNVRVAAADGTATAVGRVRHTVSLVKEASTEEETVKEKAARGKEEVMEKGQVSVFLCSQPPLC